MSAPNCLRCLVRPSTSTTRTTAAKSTIAASWSAPFSTTSANAAMPVAKKKGEFQGHYRSGSNLKIKKKTVVIEKGKSPLPGERKAYRKRIQLSNNNALAVPGLEDLGAKDLLDSRNIAKVKALPDATVDQLRAIEAFKPTQTWGMFRKPAVLIRSESIQLTTSMEEAANQAKTLRLVLTGDRLTGKSLMLLQAMTHAFQNEWLVFNIPEAQELTTACTEYAVIPGSEPVSYMQQTYVLKMLNNFKKANEKVLNRLTTIVSHTDLPTQVPANSTLLALCNSAKEADGAWAVFQALWRELTAKGQGRPPILFALDGLQHIMKVSAYRSPSFELIHSHDLALVRLFADLLGGVNSLPNGGAVIAATTRGNAPRTPSMELALEQREAEQAGEEVPQREPYFRGYDDRVEASLKAAQVLKVSGVTKAEARGLMEYWASSGVLRTTVNEAAVTEKWTLGGHGVIGEMERAGLTTTIRI